MLSGYYGLGGLFDSGTDFIERAARDAAAAEAAAAAAAVTAKQSLNPQGLPWGVLVAGSGNNWHSSVSFDPIRSLRVYQSDGVNRIDIASPSKPFRYIYWTDAKDKYKLVVLLTDAEIDRGNNAAKILTIKKSKITFGPGVVQVGTTPYDGVALNAPYYSFTVKGKPKTIVVRGVGAMARMDAAGSVLLPFYREKLRTKTVKILEKVK